ncbi:MAG TPA: hypothetical protein VG897_12350 [Terriglobales bacterium]|nr:hypothetical protein [Terriglobales bacterium]
MKSRMAGFEHDTFSAVWNSKRVWLIHIFANALLFAAFFYWLRIDEESSFHVAISVLMGAAIILCTMWLHAATLDYFHQRHAGTGTSFGDSMRAALARVPAFLVWAIVFGVVLDLIGGAWDYDAQAGGWARHMLPQFLRTHVSPRSMISAFVFFVGFIFYVLWPIVFLPIGAQVARFNFRGFFGRPLLAAFRPLRHLRFWAVYLVCFAAGMYVPYILANVVPKENASLHYQTASMIARLGIAYMLLVTGWLVVCSAITRAIEGEVPTPAPEPSAEPLAPVTS